MSLLSAWICLRVCVSQPMATDYLQKGRKASACLYPTQGICLSLSNARHLPVSILRKACACLYPTLGICLSLSYARHVPVSILHGGSGGPAIRGPCLPYRQQGMGVFPQARWFAHRPAPRPQRLALAPSPFPLAPQYLSTWAPDALSHLLPAFPCPPPSPLVSAPRRLPVGGSACPNPPKANWTAACVLGGDVRVCHV